MMNKMRVSKGSALVETTVVLVVMVPLIFGIAMVGNLIDLKQSVEQASRYASWESTVASEPSGSISNAKLQERFFSSTDTPITSEAQGVRANSLWGDADSSMGELQSATSLVLDPSSIAVLVNDKAVGSTLAMKIGQQAGRAGEILDGVRGNTWGLSTEGPSSLSISAKVKSSDWLPGSLSGCTESDTHVCLSSRAVILDDSWSASGDSHAAQRVRSLMPASVLEPVGDAVSVVGNLPLFGELKDLKGAFGYVDMSVLPEYIDQ